MLSEKISPKKVAIEQSMLLDKMDELKVFISLEEDSIEKEMTKGAIKKAKTKTQTEDIK